MDPRFIFYIQILLIMVLLYVWQILFSRKANGMGIKKYGLLEGIAWEYHSDEMRLEMEGYEDEYFDSHQEASEFIAEYLT